MTMRRNAPSELGRVCSYCGFEVPADANFCGGCGRSMVLSGPINQNALTFLQSKVPPPLVERILHSGTTMSRGRKHITARVADMRGSTAFIDKLDPERALE